MLAYRVTEENLPLIAANNDGLEPLIEGKVTYFITGVDFNDIVDQETFDREFNVVSTINASAGRYVVEKV